MKSDYLQPQQVLQSPVRIKKVSGTYDKTSASASNLCPMAQLELPIMETLKCFMANIFLTLGSIFSANTAFYAGFGQNSANIAFTL